MAAAIFDARKVIEARLEGDDDGPSPESNLGRRRGVGVDGTATPSAGGVAARVGGAAGARGHDVPHGGALQSGRPAVGQGDVADAARAQVRRRGALRLVAAVRLRRGLWRPGARGRVALRETRARRRQRPSPGGVPRRGLRGRRGPAHDAGPRRRLARRGDGGQRLPARRERRGLLGRLRRDGQPVLAGAARKKCGARERHEDEGGTVVRERETIARRTVGREGARATAEGASGAAPPGSSRATSAPVARASRRSSRPRSSPRRSSRIARRT